MSSIIGRFIALLFATIMRVTRRSKQLITPILSLLFYFSGIGCRGTTVPDTTPRETTVSVKYIRVLPLTDPYAAEIVSLAWSFPEESGGTDMPKIAEDTFEVGNVRIRTETVITINAFDLRIGAWVSKHLFVNGKNISSDSGYGTTTFVLGNDGKIRRP